MSDKVHYQTLILERRRGGHDGRNTSEWRLPREKAPGMFRQAWHDHLEDSDGIAIYLGRST